MKTGAADDEDVVVDVPLRGPVSVGQTLRLLAASDARQGRTLLKELETAWPHVDAAGRARLVRPLAGLLEAPLAAARRFGKEALREIVGEASAEAAERFTRAHEASGR